MYVILSIHTNKYLNKMATVDLKCVFFSLYTLQDAIELLIFAAHSGEMAEWSKAPVLKTGKGL